MRIQIGLFIFLVGMLLLVGRAWAETAVTHNAAALPTTTVQLLKDINPGSGDSFPEDFASVDGILYFSAFDGAHGIELWRSDGTAAGTYMIKDINPGSAHGGPYNIITYGGYYNDSVIYFLANGGNGYQIWKSDGTAAGTMQAAAPMIDPTALTVVDNTLYFFADDPLYGEELWGNNGTYSGSWLVKDINPGAASSVVTNTPVALSGKLLFVANDGTHGIELWVSDGTQAGTRLVKDINPNQGLSGAYFHNWVLWGGLVYFAGNDDQYGDEVWQTDGTSAGTVRVASPTNSSSGYAAQLLGVVNNRLYFLSASSPKLWTTDSTGTDIRLVYDFSVHDPASGSAFETALLDNRLCFNYVTGVSNLWCSDGATAWQIDINPNEANDYVAGLAALNGRLYFGAGEDGFSSVELWQSDGTTAGSRMVQDINPTASADIYNMMVVNGRLFFAADNGSNGSELWLLTELPEQVYLPTIIR